MTSTRRVFLKQVGAGIALTSMLPSDLLAQGAKKISLSRSTPEQQGISSSGIESFLRAIEQSKIEFHSVMILRHGHVVAEGWWAPYAAPLKHTLYSLSKSFTSTAVGLALEEKKFALDAPVVSFFPKDLPADVSPNLAAMKVKDLLTMSTGHAKDTIQELRNSQMKWAPVFLSLPVEHVPGTHFVYNTGATYMLSAIVQKTTGHTVLDYLKPRLFTPLGMDHLDWETDGSGITTGGYGLRIRTEDIAKFGQLYLQKGLWNGKQLIPASWVSDATSFHIDNTPANPQRPKEVDDWSQGYGYQFWRCTHGAVRGDGAFGQFCIMMPDKEVVVAITGESFDLQASMNLVWEHLYPAIKDGVLPEDKASHGTLAQKLKGLSIPPPVAGVSNSVLSEQLMGKDFKLDENSFNLNSVSFMIGNTACIIGLKGPQGEKRLTCGLNKWHEEKDQKTQVIFPMPGRPTVSTPIVASAAWKDEKTLHVEWRYVETAHSDSMTCVFDNHTVAITLLNSVARGNPKTPDPRPVLRGLLI